MSDRVQWSLLCLVMALVVATITGLFFVLNTPPEQVVQAATKKVGPQVKGESRKEKMDAPDTSGANEKPELTVIFRHGPTVSTAKLIRADAPIPDGWEGGKQMRTVSLRIAEREGTLAAMLAGGKEGDTAEYGK
jgi:hypothetical protein